MTHDQDPNLTGAGADPISGPHSGWLYQSGGHGPEFSLSEIQSEGGASCVNVRRKFYIIVCNHLSFARGAADSRSIGFKRTNSQEKERTSSRVK